MSNCYLHRRCLYRRTLFHARENAGHHQQTSVTKTGRRCKPEYRPPVSLLDVPVQLISVFGNDSDGDWLKKVCTDAGVKLDASITKEGLSGSTLVY